MPVKHDSIDELVRDAVADAMRKVAPVLQRQLAAFAAEELERSLELEEGGGTRGAARHARVPRGEMTRWVADKRARRVPTFVVEATGLDTKKKIVAKYGTNAAFEKGKPLPRQR